MTDSTLAGNLAQVRSEMTRAAKMADRDPSDVTLLAVSKTRPAADVLAALAAGQQHFGENYLQEAVAKIRAVAAGHPPITPIWHFIGAIQTNKTREIARHFDWVHTVSREKVARRLNDQCPEHRRLSICLQVNVDNDPNKAGVPPEATAALLDTCADLDRLDVRGLMTILDPATDPADGYNRLRMLFESLRGAAPEGWDTLSMGMSGDYPAAISAGATLVRVGTAIFGPRTAVGTTQNEDRD